MSRLNKPFLKWAGGKTRVLPHILPQLPETVGRFVEPFVGSAAVSLNVSADGYWLNDVNQDLVSLYEVLKAEEGFIDACKELFDGSYNNEEAFYKIREEFNATQDAFRKSCLFVCLNRHAYNGLCRYNKSGGYNVPFGRYKAPYFPEAEFLNARKLMKKAKITNWDFRRVLAECGEGDVVYCDPPYVPLSETANFTSYATEGFSHQDQSDLADAAQEAAVRGAVVILSNHDTPVSRELYVGAKIESFEVARFISCDGNNRKKAAELLAVF